MANKADSDSDSDSDSESARYTTPSVLRPLQRIRKNTQKTLNMEENEETSGRDTEEVCEKHVPFAS